MRLSSDHPSYVLFRDEFLTLAAQFGFKLHREVLPGTGSQGEPLSQDFAHIDQQSENTIVHLSGVHGVEGYLGSSIQAKILSTIGHGFRDHRVNFIFVHAVNPFGMSWYRRVNGQNVDLNRNGFSGPPPVASMDVARFSDFLESSSHWELLLKTPALLTALASLGVRRTTQAIAGGQWQEPESLFFGGTTRQAELAHLPGTLLRLAPTTKNFYVIDVHSGLGPWGHDSLLVSDRNHLDFFQRASEVPHQESHVVDTSDETPSQYYHAHGMLADFLTASMTGQSVYYMTQEFGTVSALQVLVALILENSLYKMEPGNSRRVRILLNSFFPDSASWRKTCRQAGLQRFSQLLQVVAHQN